MKTIVLLADKVVMLTMVPMGLAKVDDTGALGLESGFLDRMAAEVAKERGGMLVRAWNAHDGAFAEIEVPG